MVFIHGFKVALETNRLSFRVVKVQSAHRNAVSLSHNLFEVVKMGHTVKPKHLVLSPFFVTDSVFPDIAYFGLVAVR